MQCPDFMKLHSCFWKHIDSDCKKPPPNWRWFFYQSLILSSSISVWVKALYFPGSSRSSSSSDPILSLLSSSTCIPVLANIRLIWWYLPSEIVISISDMPASSSAFLTTSLEGLVTSPFFNSIGFEKARLQPRSRFLQSLPHRLFQHAFWCQQIMRKRPVIRQKHQSRRILIKSSDWKKSFDAIFLSIRSSTVFWTESSVAVMTSFGLFSI